MPTLSPLGAALQIPVDRDPLSRPKDHRRIWVLLKTQEDHWKITWKPRILRFLKFWITCLPSSTQDLYSTGLHTRHHGSFDLSPGCVCDPAKGQKEDVRCQTRENKRDDSTKIVQNGKRCTKTCRGLQRYVLKIGTVQQRPLHMRVWIALHQGYSTWSCSHCQKHAKTL